VDAGFLCDEARVPRDVIKQTFGLHIIYYFVAYIGIKNVLFRVSSGVARFFCRPWRVFVMVTRKNYLLNFFVFGSVI
jgi:hypothetical protein